MRFFIFLRIILLVFIFSQSLNATNFNLQAKELEIKDFINIVSKLTNTNIIMVDIPKYNLEFAINDDISGEELLEILKLSLQTKGFVFLKDNNIYKIVDRSNNKYKIRKIIELKNIESKEISEFFINSYDKNLVTFDIDKNTNKIFLYGFEKDVNEIEEFIKELDVSKEQIFVEAKIIELSLSKIKEIGFKYGLNSALYSGNSLYNLSSELGLKAGSVELPIGFDYPTKMVKSSLNLWSALSLLEQDGVIEIVSEPSILALNNQESSIYIGKRQSIQTSTSVDKNGNPIPHIERVDIGLLLKVKPRLTKNDKVMLDIVVEQEESNSKESTLYPMSDKKEILTSAIVENGENVILGGYIQNKEFIANEKIPFLGDIPAIGGLFRHKSDMIDKKSLVLILTPYIVPKDQNLTILQEQISRLKSLEKSYYDNIKQQLLSPIDKNQNSSNKEYNQIISKLGVVK
ncbi:MAG: type II secretion system protein GspD [Arcobacteraceae bacterium]|jgi:general secretion pathway protein D|nr:hypothetical protein [Arcobacteraceae bacterium]